MSNPFKEETVAIKASTKDTVSQIRSILKLVQSKIKWNERYSLYGYDVRAAIKKGAGTSADINFVLISALQDAGLSCYPVLMSPRSSGRIPYTFPSITRLQTFIVAVELTPGRFVYLDGTSAHADINILPQSLLVDRARIYGCKNAEWVDLSNLSDNLKSTTVIASIKENQLEGKVRIIHNNQCDYDYKVNKVAAKDSIEYCDKLKTLMDLELENYTSTRNGATSAKEEFAFNKQITKSADFIYINPMVIQHFTSTPFTSAQRHFPIEFENPGTMKFTCILEIPEGYKIDAMPKSESIVMGEKDILCMYNIGQIENKIILNYRYDLKQILYPLEEYKMLQDFFAKIVQKNAEKIILKKITL